MIKTSLVTATLNMTTLQWLGCFAALPRLESVYVPIPRPEGARGLTA